MLGIALGLKVDKLRVMPIGFAISFKIDTKNYNRKVLKANLLRIKKTIIAFAGPLVNLIFIISFLLYGKEKLFNIRTDTLIYANILIFLFNMIPIYPLDGGRILKNLSHIFFGKMNSLKITFFLSNINAIIITLIRNIHKLYF